MAEPTYTVRALDEATWAAFAALVERNNGIFGGCWCMGFHDDDSRVAAREAFVAAEGGLGRVSVRVGVTALHGVDGDAVRCRLCSDPDG